MQLALQRAAVHPKSSCGLRDVLAGVRQHALNMLPFGAGQTGRVVGVGTHQELLGACPTYAQFVDSQNVGAGEGGRR